MTSKRSSKKRGRKPKSKGLGDTVEKITEATGIKTLVKWAVGEDCGCDERKEKLNKLFPYQGLQCLVESEYEYLKDFQPWKKNQLEPEDQARLLNVYNRVFSKRKKITQCGKCWKNILSDLKQVFDTYEKDNE